MQAPNGRLYQQGRDLADKTTRRRIRRWGQNVRKCGRKPVLVRCIIPVIVRDAVLGNLYKRKTHHMKKENAVNALDFSLQFHSLTPA